LPGHYLSRWNSDARLDAIATLETLPKRLLRIGFDRLNGRKLSEKDYAYWRRHRVKTGMPPECQGDFGLGKTTNTAAL